VLWPHINGASALRALRDAALRLGLMGGAVLLHRPVYHVGGRES